MVTAVLSVRKDRSPLVWNSSTWCLIVSSGEGLELVGGVLDQSKAETRAAISQSILKISAPDRRFVPVRTSRKAIIVSSRHIAVWRNLSCLSSVASGSASYRAAFLYSLVGATASMDPATSAAPGLMVCCRLRIPHHQWRISIAPAAALPVTNPPGTVGLWQPSSSMIHDGSENH